MTKFLDTLAHLGGGDARALELVPSARAAFQQMAAALMFTASMATVSMWFALHDAVRVGAVAAVAFGVFWGIGIFVLDRSLMVVGMGGSRAGVIASAGGRLLAACLIGVVVSTPLTLRIFSPDIDAQLGKMQAQQSAANNDAIAKSQEQKLVDALQQKVDDWENIRTGVLPSDMVDGDSSALVQQLADLKVQAAKDQHAADQAAILYNCDMYGGGRDRLDNPSKCAAKPGPNGNAALYHSEAIQAAQKVKDDQAAMVALEQQLSAANADRLASLQTQAETQLATYRAQLASAETSLSSFRNGLEGDNMGNTGLLAQLAGLWKAGEGNLGLMIAHLLIALLFVLIEFLPVLAKLMWLFGRGGKAYEEAVATLDDSGLAVAQSKRAEAQIRAEIEYDGALLVKDGELEEKRLEIEQREQLLRIQQEADREVAQTRARDIAARRITIDGEYGALREAELRRRAAEEHEAWLSAGQGTGNVTFARFGGGGGPESPGGGGWSSWLRRGGRRAAAR